MKITDERYREAVSVSMETMTPRGVGQAPPPSPTRSGDSYNVYGDEALALRDAYTKENDNE